MFQSAKDEPMRKCEQCLGDVTKLISNCSFQLKGTGWYLTDYARKDAGTGERKHKKTDAGGETKSSTDFVSDRDPLAGDCWVLTLAPRHGSPPYRQLIISP
ncbi:MAG: hypothetical protein NTZ51_04865, partial [Proteobacteria bacterium]|nr:hypothetical protein [Pseudomonadota bacterium]